MHNRFEPAKLLITIVGVEYGEIVVAASRQAGAPGGTKAFGRGIAAYSTPGGLAHADLQENIIFSVVIGNPEKIIQAISKFALEESDGFSGMAILINAPSVFIRPGSVLEKSLGEQIKHGSERMESGTVLITSIINHGEADEIMRVARQAGAKGGTILNARGTGTEDDVKFFGISLAPEKEMLLIVADNKDAEPIMEAVCRLPIFCEPGGGIIFTSNVEKFVVLGK